MTIKQFLALFPDDDACLDHLFKLRYGADPACPKCGEIGKFRKLKRMPAYTCNCGHHIHPMQDTPFALTRTPLQKWFYAMFLFTTTRNGLAAKEIQRQLGVTYKCAWRMCKLIREYMGYVDGDAPLGGSGRKPVEVDEAFIGGKDKRGEDDKAIILGMVEREGEILTRPVIGRGEYFVVPHIMENIKKGAQVMTDDDKAFINLETYGFKHASVNHSAKEYVRGDCHTNTIEGFWSWFKRGVNGTYVHVSKKHLQKYLWEFEFRFNLRKNPHLMFPLLVSSFSKASSLKPLP
jgi:transposase-like protein/predicted RNA-binding Zn-ribbon protein involved in translation (DUF1610 family)